MQRATIQDVARAAGVSVSSVSHYQNGRQHHMRGETIERIKDSIKALNYSPSRVARQLKSGQTPMVGLLIPSIVNPYHAELALALDSAAQQHGFRTVLGNGHRDPLREKAFIDELVEYGVRGFIVTSELRNATLMRDYVRRGVAFVLFDLRASEVGIEGIDVVSIDNALATSMAVDYLVSLGHRSIAYVTKTPLSANRVARLGGYTSALRRHGLGTPLVIASDNQSVEEQGESDLAYFGQRISTQLLKIRPRITAVIAINDIVAIGIFAGLRKLGVDVPGDISLLGIDDIQFSAMMAPSLTTLRPDYGGMATKAIDYLHSRLADPKLANRESIYAPELIIRESATAPCTASGLPNPATSLED
ncbi:MAG: LacI family DNA-binding transcriptional regulator [Propionivibrio sp.]